MFQDESRFGRINEVKRCWAQKTVRPIINKQIIREYTYVYGAFSPMDGGMDSLVLPNMHTNTMNIFLREVSARHEDELILMVVDGAASHGSEELNIPSNMNILKLPPYCPQLNPSENMWDEIKEKFFSNRTFASMDLLEDHLCATLKKYEESPAIVKSISKWDWISQPICSFLNAI